MIDLTAESKVLNALCSHADCIDQIEQIKPEYFTEKDNRTVFEVIRSMYEDGDTVSVVSVAMKTEKMVKAGGKWKFEFSSGGEFGVYVNRLRDNHKRRELHKTAQEIVEAINQGKPVGEMIDALQNKVYTISSEITKAEIITPSEHAARIAETIAGRMDNKSSGGIRTSLAKLNKAINGGYQPGELVILAAKTGKGKTAFAMNQMRDIAITQKVPSLYVNTEMNPEQMDIRWGAMLTPDDPALTYEKMATGQLNDAEYTRLIAALNAMHISGFHSVTIPDLTIAEVISLAKRAKAQQGIKFLVLDYVGRMDTQVAGQKEWEVLKLIAKRLKTLAQQLEMTVIMLAQITEDGNLEGARAMKNECDLFGHLREMTGDESAEYSGSGFNYFLEIDKNRNGRRGKIALKFTGEKMTFEGEQDGQDAKMGTVQPQQRRDYRTDGGQTTLVNGGNRRPYSN